jgi:ankyrin repeat protein
MRNQKIPHEIIDRIILKLNDIHISTSLKRDYVSEKLCKNNNYSIDTESKNGHLDVVKFLYDKGANYTTNAMNYASKNGHLDIVKYLHKVGSECTNAIGYASENGHLEVVKFLYSIGKVCEPSVMNMAAKNGHIEVVKYLQSIGTDFYNTTVYSAITNGHLEVVKFLYTVKPEYYCKWVMELAEMHNRIEIVKWLRLHLDISI